MVTAEIPPNKNNINRKDPEIENNKAKNYHGMWKALTDTFKSNHMFAVTLFIFIFVNISIFVLAALFPNWDVRYTPSFPLCHPLGTCPPSLAHLLGTTYKGYDNLVCLINGARNSLIIGYGAAGISVPIAVLVGIIGGYKGGVLDNFLSTVTNIFLVLPVVSVYMLIAANVGAQGTAVVIVLIGILIWPWAARSIRSQVLSLKERDFVNLSRVTGESSIGIAIKEIMPNMLSYILLVFAMETVIGIGTEAALTIIGVAAPDQVTLGLMLQWAVNNTFVFNGELRPDIYYMLWITPGLMLLLIVMIIYFLQASMPQIFNPRLREK